MSDKHHKETKKEKKLSQLLHNKRIQRINLAEEEHVRQRDLHKEREEEREKATLAASRSAASAKKKEAQPVWSARVQQIQDRTTGRARAAESKWNRFAGTEAGGGRGL